MPGEDYCQTVQEIACLIGHKGKAMIATYSRDGQRILTTSSDGAVQIYTTDMDELLEIAKSRVTRQLTVEEKERYGVPDW